MDYETFSTRQPQADVTNSDGDCLDTLTISGSMGITKNSNSVQVYPPIICGENSGQHMYLDAGRESSADITLSNRYSKAKDGMISESIFNLVQKKYVNRHPRFFLL